MNLFTRIHAARPWQLLAVLVVTQLALLLMIMVLPTWRENAVVGLYKGWQLSGFATFGMALDMVLNYRSRPGSTSDETERFRRELRRAAYVVGAMLAGGLAL